MARLLDTVVKGLDKSASLLPAKICGNHGPDIIQSPRETGLKVGLGIGIFNVGANGMSGNGKTAAPSVGKLMTPICSCWTG